MLPHMTRLTTLSTGALTPLEPLGSQARLVGEASQPGQPGKPTRSDAARSCTKHNKSDLTLGLTPAGKACYDDARWSYRPMIHITSFTASQVVSPMTDIQDNTNKVGGLWS